MDASDMTGRREVSVMADSKENADAMVDQLIGAGIPRDDISVVDGETHAEVDAGEDKGFMASLSDFFFGEEDRATYSEGLRRGGYLVVAHVDAAHYDTAMTILDQEEYAVDLNQRAETWRAEGWQGHDEPVAAGDAGYRAGPMGGMGERDVDERDVAGMTGRAADLSRDTDTDGGTIELAEERLRIGTRDVEHGRVRIRSYVVSEDVSKDVTLRSEHVDVERRKVDRPVEGSADAFADRTIELTETGQEAVVSKEARVVEEIDLRKTAEEHVETVSDTVRHTEVEVDDQRLGGTVRRDPADPDRKI